MQLLALRKQDLIGSYLLMGLIFFLPISTSLSTGIALLIIPVWLWQNNFTNKFQRLQAMPVIIPLFLFILLHIIGLLWTSDMNWGLTIVKKQWKLLLLPILATTAITSHRRYYCNAFVLSMLISCFLSYLLWFELLHLKHISPYDPTPFIDHISYNAFLAFSIYILVNDLLLQHFSKQYKAVVLFIIGTMIFDMFITQGRAGQLYFFILVLLVTIRVFKFNYIKTVFAYFFITTLLVVTMFVANGHNPDFMRRTGSMHVDILNYKEKPENSVGQRLTFLKNSWSIITDNPLVGVGTGDFPSEYARINQLNSPEFPNTDNPHNQYILVLCQFGILGLIIFLSIFYRLGIQSLDIRDGWQPIRIAFLLLMIIMMLSDAYILGHAGAFFFVVCVSILFGEEGNIVMQVEKKGEYHSPL